LALAFQFCIVVLGSALFATPLGAIFMELNMKYIPILILIACIFVSCNKENNTAPIPPSNTSEIFLFAMRGDGSGDKIFAAKTSDTIIINKLLRQLDLPPEKRNLHIHGIVSAGNGGFNLKWDWYLIPDKWDVVESSMELCDCDPQFVTRNILAKDSTAWFCPWASYVFSKQE
jgi:hypothetical protein